MESSLCYTVSMRLQSLRQVLDIIERTTDTLAGDRRMHAEWRQSAVLGSAVDETSRMYSIRMAHLQWMHE